MPVGPEVTQEDVDYWDPARLGGELRDLRKARGLTLAELARRVGRSVGYLSEIERGRKVVPVGDLHKLAKALRVPVAWFLVRSEDAKEERGRVVRWGYRRCLDKVAHGLAEELLSPNLGGAFEMVHCTFGPHAELTFHATRDTEETGYILSGELELWIGGDYYHLTQGDSFHVCREPLRWRNPTEGRTAVIWVIAPPLY